MKQLIATAVVFALVAGYGVTASMAGSTVDHGDGSTRTFTANDSDTGLSLLFTWTDKRGDIIRTGPKGDETYKITARQADVLAYVTAAGPVAGFLGDGTANISVYGDHNGGTVGANYLNFFSRGILTDTFLPPPVGVGFADYDFHIQTVFRNGELKLRTVDVSLAD